MLLGVYTKSYVEYDPNDLPITVKHYASVEELALMNFLDYMQRGENDLVNRLSESGKHTVKRIMQRFISSMECKGILGLVLYFVREAPNSLYEEIAGLCGNYVGAKDEEMTQKVFNAVYDSDEEIFAVKRVIFSEKEGAIPKESVCNIAIPAAYLIRSNRDAENNLKIWPSDEDVYDIMKILSKGVYYTDNRLNSIVSILATKYSVAPGLLCTMVQCLLADKVLELKKRGFDLDCEFETVVDALFKCVL
jgi:hypothetical protein